MRRSKGKLICKGKGKAEKKPSFSEEPSILGTTSVTKFLGIIDEFTAQG
jgi:hypothetical protein